MLDNLKLLTVFIRNEVVSEGVSAGQTLQYSTHVARIAMIRNSYKYTNVRRHLLFASTVALPLAKL